MPKIPRDRWGEYGLEPESEEYNPSSTELKEDEEAKQAIETRLSDIFYEIDHPGIDPYTGEKNRFNITDPEFLWNELAYLRIDYLNKIKDPELRKSLEGQITQAEKETYKQYIPFIDSEINRFGWYNSPLNRQFSKQEANPEKVKQRLDIAHSALEHLDLSEEDRLDFLSELDRLKEKFGRYRREPTLFNFEEIEEKLQKDLAIQEHVDFFWPKKETIARQLEKSESTEKNLEKLNEYLARTNRLREIAENMMDDNIKKQCQARARALSEWAEYLKMKFESPRELAILRATIEDLKQRAENQSKINEEEIRVTEAKLSEIREKKLGFEYQNTVRKFEKLFKYVKRLIKGENIEEEHIEIDTENTEVDWAWSRLGIQRQADDNEIKKAYKKLVFKYHPDRNKSKNAPEIMQKINEAYEFLRRIKKFK